METVRAYFKKKSVLIGAVLIVGIALGLLYAWVINPVEWINGEPAQLREDLRVDYLRMVIESYDANLDAELAMRRFKALGDFGDETLELVAADPGEVSASALQKFQALVAIEAPEIGASGEAEQPSVPAEEEPAEEVSAARPSAARYILPVCGATLLLGALLGVALLLRRRLEARETGLGMDFDSVEEAEYEAAPHVAEPMAAVEEEPLATFRTTYTIGDDLYDDSFSIESPATGDFLGECGVGIADVIGVGEPKKVSAFEVWLFDKNDIQTVTKILLSSYAFKDEETRGRLAAKGDLILAESGETITLDTASLQVEARIVDMSYGEGALPAESFFDRMTIEIRARAKTT